MSEVIEENGTLVRLQDIDPAALFSADPEPMNELIALVAEKVEGEPPDLTTAAGRKRINSLAYQVSRSKTAIDDLGKQAAADLKRRTGEIDARRKQAREALDTLRDRVKKPFTDWEAEQVRIAEEQRLAKEAEERRVQEAREAAERQRQAEIDAENARRDAELAERERAVKEAEAAQAERERQAAAAEAEKQREAEAALAKERAEKERLAREEQIRKEAEQQARRDAETKAQAELDRVAREAAEREAAIQREADEKAKQEARDIADKANREWCECQVIEALTSKGLTVDVAVEVVGLVSLKMIPRLSIDYSRE